MKLTPENISNLIIHNPTNRIDSIIDNSGYLGTHKYSLKKGGKYFGDISFRTKSDAENYRTHFKMDKWAVTAVNPHRVLPVLKFSAIY